MLVHSIKKKSGLTETAQRILELMKQEPTITYDKIAVELGEARSGIAKQKKNWLMMALSFLKNRITEYGLSNSNRHMKKKTKLQVHLSKKRPKIIQSTTIPKEKK